MHLDRVTADAELATTEGGVVAVVLHVDQAPQDAAHVVVDVDRQVEELPLVLVGVAHAVDAAHRRDHDHVAASEERGGRRVAETIDLVVDRAVLLDEGVARRDVRLGLVVVVVADEVLDPVVGEELAHLLGELGGERLVRGEDQRGSLHLLDRPRDRGRLARAGDAEQRLEPLAGLDALRQRLDRLRLVARRRELRDHLEHGLPRGGLRRSGVGHATQPTPEHSFGEAASRAAAPSGASSTRRRRSDARQRGGVRSSGRTGTSGAGVVPW
jgi:hypothetical protein